MQRGLAWFCLLLLSGTPGDGAYGAQEAERPLAEAALSSLAPGIEVQVLELRRSAGNTVTLRLRLRNTTDETRNPVQKHLTRYDRSDVGAVSLVDYANQKRYIVIKDSNGNCLCSSGNYGVHELPPGESREFWAKFAAPPDDVSTVSVVIPGGPPLDDVPLAR